MPTAKAKTINKKNTASKSQKSISIPSDQVINELKLKTKSPWLPFVIDMLDGTGLRVGELCGTQTTYKASGELRFTNRAGLTVGDVAEILPFGEIIVKKEFTVVGKGNKERNVPIGKKAKQAIIDLIHHFSSYGEDYLLAPIKRETVARNIKKARESFGFTGKLTAHSMRHRINSKLVKAGKLKEAQMLSGHSDPRVTLAFYTSVSVEEIAEAIDSL